MPRTRVKICGLTQCGDSEICVDAGADAVGVVFSKSVRQVDVTDASVVLNRATAFVSTVAVFSEPDVPTLEKLNSEHPRLFSHWQIDAEHCWRAETAFPNGPALIPVYHWGAPDRPDVRDYFSPHNQGTPLVEGPRSGSGQAFNWNELAPFVTQRRIILAGGLTPDNVAQAIRTVRPYGVDVSSGVESSPGKKDPIKIRDFLQAVRDVDRELQ